MSTTTLEPNPGAVVTAKQHGVIVWKDDSKTSDELCSLSRDEPLLVLRRSDQNPDILKVVDRKGRIGFVFKWRVEEYKK